MFLIQNYRMNVFVFSFQDAVMLHSFTLRQQLQTARQGGYRLKQKRHLNKLIIAFCLLFRFFLHTIDDMYFNV